MIEVRLHSRTASGDKMHYYYRIGQQDMLSNLRLELLSSFERLYFDIDREIDPRAGEINIEEATLLYDGPGWIGNEWRRVNCYSIFSGYQIDVERVGTFWIAEDGEQIALTRDESEARIDLVIEAMLGPALILALALHGIYCLHGSAVMLDQRAVLFLGESGQGKSTLAHWLGAQERGTWRRIGDDILPVSLREGKIDLLPHFPQLKLPADEQPSAGLAERIPIAALFVLGRPADGDTAEILPLSAQDGALALVRHTVASRLFDTGLLANQLDFAVHAADQVPVKDLLYPFEPHVLEEVQHALLADLQMQQAYVDFAAQLT